MEAWPDYRTWLLAAGVVLLFALFFWHVVRSFIGAGKHVANYLDTSSARQRAALERERKFGKVPLWLRALRVLFVTLTLLIVAVAFWQKFRL